MRTPATSLFNLVIFIIGVCFLTSCDKRKLEKQLSGRWTMVELTCGFCDAPRLKKGEIIWDFDTKNSKLLVENNSGEPKTYLSTGTYNFIIDQTTSKITIESRLMDYRFESNNLIISDKPELDGPLYRFASYNK